MDSTPLHSIYQVCGARGALCACATVCTQPELGSEKVGSIKFIDSNAHFALDALLKDVRS